MKSMKYCSRKKCAKQGILLPYEQFNKCQNTKDGLQKSCKNCQHDNYMQNRDKIIQRSLKNQKNNPNRKLIVRKHDLKRRFNLTIEEYNNLFNNQGGLCAICKVSVHDKNLAVDHNHNNGQIRGLLCIPCNLVIGNAKDNKNILLNAIEYLELYNGN